MRRSAHLAYHVDKNDYRTSSSTSSSSSSLNHSRNRVQYKCTHKYIHIQVDMIKSNRQVHLTIKLGFVFGCFLDDLFVFLKKYDPDTNTIVNCGYVHARPRSRIDECLIPIMRERGGLAPGTSVRIFEVSQWVSMWVSEWVSESVSRRCEPSLSDHLPIHRLRIYIHHRSWMSTVRRRSRKPIIITKLDDFLRRCRMQIFWFSKIEKSRRSIRGLDDKTRPGRIKELM